MTETSTVVVSTSELDTLVGSSGSLLPGIKAKIIDSKGKEVTDYETPGELLVQSSSVVLGYLNNEKATAETFFFHEDGRWIKTGDEVLVRKSAQGNEHFVIVDRIKELIKVKVCTILLLRSEPLLNKALGSSSRSRRVGISPPHPPACFRLCSHPSPRRTCWRTPQSLCRQIS